MSKILVWDPWVRCLHGLLIGLVAAAWWTGDSGTALHHWLGYAIAGVVGLRIGWGFVGSPTARFASWLCGPGETIAYFGLLARGRAPRYLGHNPAGAAMIVALLTCLATLVVTGWLYTTDWLWGYAWLAKLHAGLAEVLLGLIALHIGGVLITGWRHRENLVAAMIHGRKRPASGDDRSD